MNVSRRGKAIFPRLFLFHHEGDEGGEGIWNLVKAVVIAVWIVVGWETASGRKWGAIWRYQPGNNFYIPQAQQTRNFVGNVNLTGRTATLYRFNFSQNPPTFSSIGTLYINPS